jgi:cell division protein FtsI (penicillin-binding protein 3)
MNERDALMNPDPRHNARESRSSFISLALRVGTLLGLAIVIGRVVQLQLAPGQQLEEFIAARTTSKTLSTTRGDLLDRRGRVLATTSVGYRVILDPVGLEKAMENDAAALDRVIVGLSDVLELEAEEVALKIFKKLGENSAARLQAQAGDRAQASSGAGKNRIATTATLGVGASPATSQNKTLRLSRYMVIGSVLDQQQTTQIRELKKVGSLPSVTLEHAPVRMQTGESLVGPIVGKVGFAPKATEKTGVIGAEKIFDERLRGIDGSLSYVRDAEGQPLWVQRGAWVDSDKGQDVRLSIDIELQRIVYEQLLLGVEQADAAGGRAIVLNPHTGEVLAMTDVLRDVPNLAEVDWWDPKSDEPRPRMPDEEDQPRYRVLKADPKRSIEPALGHNRCLEDIYEPGSTFKPFAWTLAKTKGLIPDDEVLDIKEKAVITPYGRRVEDAFVYSDLDGWDDVLRYSSNIGMSIATERLSFEDLRSMVKQLGFGDRTGISLAGESPGLVTSSANWSNYTQTSVGMGYEVGVTPIQMVRAFSVFARKGSLAGTLPEVRLTATGDRAKPGMVSDEVIVRRVFSPEAVARTIAPMQAVAERMDTTMRRQYPDEPTPLYSMYGKSGTSHIAMVPPKGKLAPKSKKSYYAKQHHSSFLVAAPAVEPQIVVLVVIDDIGPDRVSKKQHYGSWVAGPVVRRIVERSLPYLGVASDLEIVDGNQYE